MKFGLNFEFQKIPEWYSMYFDYEKAKQLILLFKKKNIEHKLPDSYRFIRKGKSQQYIVKSELKQDHQEELIDSETTQESHQLPHIIDNDNCLKVKNKKNSDAQLNQFEIKNEELEFQKDTQIKSKKQILKNIADMIQFTQSQHKLSKYYSDKRKSEIDDKEIEEMFLQVLESEEENTSLDQYEDHHVPFKEKEFKFEYNNFAINTEWEDNFTKSLIDEENDQKIITQKQIESQEQMEKWVKDYISEVDRVNNFYIGKLKEYLLYFIQMQAQFLKKMNVQRLQQQYSKDLDEEILRCKKQSSYEEFQMEPQIDDDIIFPKNDELDTSSTSATQSQKNSFKFHKIQKQKNSYLVRIEQNKETEKNKQQNYQNFSENLSGKNISKIKDGFEYSVNWIRVFTDLYRNLEWLNSFAELNELAMHKILKKFSKNFFQDPKNHLQKDIKEYLSKKPLSNRKNIRVILENLYTFIVLHMTQGDQKQARELLKNLDNKIRQQDATKLSLYGGGSIIMIIFSIFYLIVNQKNQVQEDNLELFILLKIYRTTLIPIYIIFASGFAVQIFQQYKINYIVIFDLDIQYKMTHYELYKASFFLLFIQSSFFVLTMMQIQFKSFFDYSGIQQSLWVVLVFIIILLLYLFQLCFKCGYRRARKEVLFSFQQIILSPFGRVKFRDFFLADILTSIVQTLQDMAFTLYIFYPQNLISDEPIDLNSNFISISAWVISILPFWFRLMQCLKRFYQSRLIVNIYNAGKYFSKIVPSMVVIYYQSESRQNPVKKLGYNGFTYYLISNIIATLWCSVWDYYMDWGLFRSFKKGKFMLRDQIRFPKQFYYFAIVINFILRFFWLISIVSYSFEKDKEMNLIKTWDLIVFSSIIAEAIRRTLWGLLRVENEFFNNFENYKSINSIPDLIDEIDDIGKNQLRELQKQYGLYQE